MSRADWFLPTRHLREVGAFTLASRAGEPAAAAGRTTGNCTTGGAVRVLAGSINST